MIRLNEERRRCYRCQGTDTVKIALAEDESCVVYCGWCNKCNGPYSYRMQVDIIWDRQGRI